MPSLLIRRSANPEKAGRGIGSRRHDFPSAQPSLTTGKKKNSQLLARLHGENRRRRRVGGTGSFYDYSAYRRTGLLNDEFI